jgi:GxxExxY protein
MDILYKEESYRIMGACFEVYKDKGSGFVEPVYQECLALEFGYQGIQFAEQMELALTYKGRTLKQTYKPDFVCFKKIIVEIKAVSKLTDEHRAQVHNYQRRKGEGGEWHGRKPKPLWRNGFGSGCVLFA